MQIRLLAAALALTASTALADPISLTLAPPKPISPDLFGIFFEDINYAADGGLYAELLQNRSFEYQSSEQLTWNNASFWELATEPGGKGKFSIEDVASVHPSNPHYAVLEVNTPGKGVGLSNPGFDGIPVRAGKTYDVSLMARQLFNNDRWGKDAAVKTPMPLTARLESKDGTLLGEASLSVDGDTWKRTSAAITATASDDNAHFTLLALDKGGIALDDISLFPHDTFHNRPNGLRPDLAQTLADLHPHFVRFPGGCVSHGNGIANIYRWKDTIGPVETRRQQSDLWGYHQSVGLGYFEYFQFCEDIGAKPLPVIAAGVSCQNSAHVAGIGQQCIPMDQMPAYIKDIQDLIEWANGPATSTWGSKRAAAGHPEPFHLEYLGIGNEDAQTPGFNERFTLIYNAIHAKHPEIQIIGTVGPFPDGDDFDKGWKTTTALHVPFVDEHYYEPQEWFWQNLTRYDTYDRAKPHVYVGEYAARGTGTKNNSLAAALAEAAYMTHLEQNADVVRLASYAPLLAKRGHTQWTPDLIYFDNTTISPSINYYVQQAFSANTGDTDFPVTLKNAPAQLAASCVRDSRSGDVILKLVNGSDASFDVQPDLTPAGSLASTATQTTLTADPNATTAKPSTAEVRLSSTLHLPPNSLTVLRIRPK